MAVECTSGCLSSDLRRFLDTGKQAAGTPSHQVLRKLLSICTGKSDLSGSHEGAAAPLAGLQVPGAPGQRAGSRVLRPRQRALPPQQAQAQAAAKRSRKRGRAEAPCGPQPQQRPALEQPPVRRRGSKQGRQQEEEQQHAAEVALCGDLVDIVRRESGVVLALALHAIHIWSQGSATRTEACIRLGLLPRLLQVLSAVLVESQPQPSPTAAYAASMVVILLRTLTRSGAAGMAAFVSSGGVGALLHMLPALHEDRALCLVLYLLSDVTRRSQQALAQAQEQGGVALVVACLRHPLGESTKFAALLINRWCLLAPLGEQFRAAGALSGLLCVLRRQHGVLAAAVPALDGADQAQGAAARALMSEVAAYSLSALSILGQEDQEGIRELLVGCPDNLAAFTHALAHHEQAFRGTGFPHALVSSLLQGEGGAVLAAQLLCRPDLLPVWLSLRQVGWELVERAAWPDVEEAIARLPAAAQGNVTQSLTMLLPHGKAFLRPLACPTRLAALTQSAVTELLTNIAPTSSAAAPAASLDATGAAGSPAVVSLSAAVDAAVASSACQQQPEQQQQQQRQQESQLMEKATGPGADPSVPSPLARVASGLSEAAAGECRSRGGPGGSLPEAEQQQQEAQQGEHGEGRLEGGQPLQRGVSITPKAIIELEATQAEPVPPPHPLRPHQEQQQQQRDIDIAPAGRSAENPSPVGRCHPHGFAPFTASLCRLLAALANGQAASDMASEASGAPQRLKRGRDSPATHSTCKPAAKRSRSVFSRDQVNVRRYDTLTFLVGGHEFHAVGFVLEAHSPLLASLLGTLGSLHEALPIPCVAGLGPHRMHQLFGWAVEFCYTGGVEGLAPADALDLWTLAEFLQIDGLQRECEAALSSGASAGAPAPTLGERYALGLAYPSGSRLRGAVAREVLQQLAAQARRQQGQQAGGDHVGSLATPTAGAAGAAAAALCGQVSADVAAVLAAHPWELAADMADVLAADVQAVC
ncbi:hypothetical protein N2152v2_004666 [Parachlorella kessleri]